MAGKKYKENPDPIHDFLDKLCGGTDAEDGKQFKERQERLEERAAKSGTEILYGRGGGFIPMPPLSNNGRAPGLQVEFSSGSESPNEEGFSNRHTSSDSRIASRRGRGSPLEPRSNLVLGKRSLAGARMLSRHSQRSITDPSLLSIACQHSLAGGRPFGPRGQSPFIFPAQSVNSSPLADLSSSRNMSGQSSEPISRPRPHESHSSSILSNIGGSQNGPYAPNASTQGSAHHSSSMQAPWRPLLMNQPRHTSSPGPSLHELHSSPVVWSSQRSQHQSESWIRFKSEEDGARIFAPVTEAPKDKYRIMTSQAQLGDMQRTYYEGLVSMTPTEIATEEKESKEREKETEKIRCQQAGGWQSSHRNGS